MNPQPRDYESPALTIELQAPVRRDTGAVLPEPTTWKAGHGGTPGVRPLRPRLNAEGCSYSARSASTGFTDAARSAGRRVAMMTGTSRTAIDAAYTSGSSACASYNWLRSSCVSPRVYRHIGMGSDGSRFSLDRGKRSDSYRVYLSDERRRAGEKGPRPEGLRPKSGWSAHYSPWPTLSGAGFYLATLAVPICRYTLAACRKKNVTSREKSRSLARLPHLRWGPTALASG